MNVTFWLLLVYFGSTVDPGSRIHNPEVGGVYYSEQECIKATVTKKQIPGSYFSCEKYIPAPTLPQEN